MNEFLKKYNDMSAYYVTIDKKFIIDVLSKLSQNMNFFLEKQEENYYLYKCLDDERKFLLATKCSQTFYGISIKCRVEEKELFFNTIEPQLFQTQELWGMPHININDYPNRLTYVSESKNPIEEDLIANKLI